MDIIFDFSPIAKAKTILGSYEAVGRVCGVSGKAVMKWVKAGRLPRTEWTGETKYALAIEAATGGLVTRSELRPDIWPPEQKHEQPNRGAAWFEGEE